MSSDSTQDLARALVADLRKVRRQPRLGAQLLALAGLWGGVTLATLGGLGGGGALVSPMDYWLSGCVAAGLLLLAGAAAVAGVAAATPGLEMARNRAAGL